MSTPGDRAKFRLSDDPPATAKPPKDPTRPELLGGMRPDVPPGRILVTSSHGFQGYEIMSYQGVC
ncbi:MAG TPA: hypothetical protein VFL14_07005, partial [Xanthomonadales bacterium]|nr:hypothetical protein [Xanthomonadales bacterium]